MMLCRGCNVLHALKLNCPSLATLDATFCTQLDSLALSRALTGAPRLDALVLSVCMGLDPVIPATMTSIAYLSLLDLSYTGLQVARKRPTPLDAHLQSAVSMGVCMWCACVCVCVY